MAGLTGLEPATSCVTGRRSNQAELQPLAGRKSGRNLHRFVTTPKRESPKGSENEPYVTVEGRIRQVKLYLLPRRKENDTLIPPFSPKGRRGY